VKVLVTGGTGFIGPKVVRAIVESGHDVRALARNPQKASHVAELGAELVEGDLTDADSLRSAAAGVEAVVNLVAIRQGRPEEFQRIMIDGNRSLLLAAGDAGVQRFVLMSALGTTDETKDLVPYYGAKWQMEQDVRASSIPHVIHRPCFAFGKDGGILVTFRKIAKLAPVTPIPGPGHQRIQPIWVDDIAEYFARSLELDAATNRTFELGGPDVVSWNEFWERLKKALGIRRPSVHVPIGLVKVQALVTERLPGNIPLTRDLLKMLQGPDNVVTNDDAVRTFQLPLVPLDEQLRRAA
jgi:uncharacterized protein YbjT (DUF2867 family)